MLTKTIVLTGATSGLGQLAAIELAKQGARLVLPARNPDKADQTRQRILAAVPRAELHLYQADLARIADVRRVGEQIARDHPKVDVLINNAGVHAFESRTSPDGYSEMVAVNYLAPWLLTRTLLPAIMAAPAARVVTVASEASRRHGTLEIPDDLTRVVPFTRRGSSEHYGRSKLLDIMFTLELVRRLEGTAITSNCLDPGFNVTGLGREVPGAPAIERVLKLLRVGDPSRGAGLIVTMATDPAFGSRTGEYWTVRGPQQISPTPPADHAATRAKLWGATEQLLQAQADDPRRR
ncbi:SDR family NAD(P)-dependent oxidoreductase [Arthrobacter sp. NA-172]|uniref:SDR family NAD(P)-dependent oxidoreductase n=1 Tax=Arthrobacter sp. NA-172 TaxID=3367524 RepID=UPI0037549706